MGVLEEFDESTLLRYLRSPYAPLGEGYRCVCFATPTLVVKVFRTPDEILERFRLAGIDLGAAPWAPAEGDGPRSAEILAELARTSAARALLELPDLTGLIAGQFNGDDRFGELELRGPRGETVATLGRRSWLLQHRATPLCGPLASEDPTVARRAVSMLLDAIEALWKRGATPETRHFADAFGFFEGRLILLDVGEVSFGEQAVHAERTALSILSGQAFRALEAHAPATAQYLRAEAMSRWGTEGTPCVHSSRLSESPRAEPPGPADRPN